MGVDPILLKPDIPKKIRIFLNIEIILSRPNIRMRIGYNLIESMDLVDQTVEHKDNTERKRDILVLRGRMSGEVSPF